MTVPVPITTRLEQAANRPGGAVTFVTHHERQRISWAQLHEEARIVGAGLQARGIEPGDHVAILSPTTRGLVTTIQACWLVGAASMVLPLPDADGLAGRVRRRHPGSHPPR